VEGCPWETVEQMADDLHDAAADMVTVASGEAVRQAQRLAAAAVLLRGGSS